MPMKNMEDGDEGQGWMEGTNYLKTLQTALHRLSPVLWGLRLHTSGGFLTHISLANLTFFYFFLLIFLCIANDKTSGRNETDRRLSRSRAFSSFDLFKTNLVSSLSHFRAIWAASSPFHYGFAIEPRRGRSINPAVTGRKSAVKRVRIERERIDYMQLKLDPLLDNNLDLLIIIQPWRRVL